LYLFFGFVVVLLPAPSYSRLVDTVFGVRNVGMSVVLSVHHAYWSDLLQVKTKIFFDGPCMAPLHFKGWKVNGQG